MKKHHYTVKKTRQRELWSQLTNLEQAAYIHAAVEFETAAHGAHSLREASSTVRTAMNLAYASYQATNQSLEDLNPKGFEMQDHPDKPDTLVLVQVDIA